MAAITASFMGADGGTVGAMAGGAIGFMVGGPSGAAIGASIGGGVGTYAETGDVGAGLAYTAGGLAGNSLGGPQYAMMGASMGTSAYYAAKGPPDVPDLGGAARSQDYAREILLNKQANDAPIPIIYGRRRVGGTRVFMETTGSNNENIVIALVIGEGKIGGYEAEYVDDVNIEDGGQIDAHTTFWNFTGSDTQSAAYNMGEPDSWTSSHKLSGTAYLFCNLEYDKDVWERGLPTITVDVMGLQVYDPRTDSTAFSDNPALCIRDYLTNTRYGRGIDTSLIDDDAIIEAANYCDEMITIGGQSVKRYTCNGILNPDNRLLDNTRRLLTSCRGILVFSAGKYKLLIDKPETAAFTFTEDIITGSWQISMGSKSNTFNRVKANIFNKDKDWNPDIITADSPAHRAVDNGVMLESEIELPMISDAPRAKMLATMALNQSRQQVACSFTATIDGLRCEVGDVVKITHSTPGWTDKEFRVVGIMLKNSHEVAVTVVEYDVTVYDYGTISTFDATPNTNLPDPTVMAPPSNLSVTEELYETIGSSGVKVRATVAWSPPPSVFFDHHEVEKRLNGTASWRYVTDTSGNETVIDDIETGVHDFRVRAISTMGGSSTWTTLSNHTIVGLSAKPEDVDNLSMAAVNGNAHMSWDRATALDVRVGGEVTFRHSGQTAGATWANATPIGQAVSGNNTNTVLPLTTGTYMAKFRDSTGNESESASSHVVTTVPSLIGMTVVETSTQDPSFSGTKTNMLVETSGTLNVGALLGIDEEPGLIDDWGMIDDVGGIDLSTTSGTYDFDSVIDLGAVFTSRVTANVEFTAYAVDDTIDGRTELIDAWDDIDNAPASAWVAVQVSTTDDDPSGSPTWGVYENVVTGDYRARGYKFRLSADTGSSDHQTDITGLSVQIDMPDRVQGESDIQSGAGTKSVTFPDAFHTTPAIGITASDLAQNDRIVLSNESATGFDVAFYQGNGTGSPQDRKFNYLARGY